MPLPYPHYRRRRDKRIRCGLGQRVWDAINKGRPGFFGSIRARESAVADRHKLRIQRDLEASIRDMKYVAPKQRPLRKFLNWLGG